jgi:hypothetical protein
VIVHKDSVKERTVPEEKTSPFYCSNFYKGLYIQKNDSDTVSVSSCCVNTLSPTRSHVIDFHHNEYLQQQRSQSQNQRVQGCQECWRQENRGQSSYRQLHNAWYREQFPDLDPYSTELIKLDYNVDPICNAKCIICGSHFSSLWAQEDREFGEIGKIRSVSELRSNRAVLDLDLSRLRRLYFNGGEPLLSKEPLELLLKIKQQGDISLLHCQLSTNGSIRPDPDLVDLWRQCHKVDIFVSLDATGTEFEYIRYPLQWSQVWENIRYMGTLSSNIFVNFSFTLGVHNIDCFPKAQGFLISQIDRINGGDIGFNHCHGNLRVDKASRALLESWKQKYALSDDSPIWQRNLMYQIKDEVGQQNDDVWKQHLDWIDQRRKLNWRVALPELAEQEKVLSH